MEEINETPAIVVTARSLIEADRQAWNRLRDIRIIKEVGTSTMIAAAVDMVSVLYDNAGRQRREIEDYAGLYWPARPYRGTGGYANRMRQAVSAAIKIDKVHLEDLAEEERRKNPTYYHTPF